MPLTIEEFGIEKLIDGEIIGCDLCGGDYGMGSLGFFELKIQTVKMKSDYYLFAVILPVVIYCLMIEL